MNVQHQVCFDSSRNLLNYNSFNYTSNSDFVEYLKNITNQKTWFDASTGYWNDELKPEFSETLTRYGIGFSFNLLEDFDLIHLNATSNDFRYSYDDKFPRKSRPWKTGARLENGLLITFYNFDFSTWIFSTCRYSGLIVHSPFELPIGLKFTNFDYGRTINVWITPEIIQTDDDLRWISSEDRKCYFDDERNLTFFKMYTQRNCEMECLSFIGENFSDFFQYPIILKFIFLL